MYCLLLLHFFSFLVYLELSVYIMVKNPRAFCNRICAVFLFCFSLWSLGMFIMYDSACSGDTARLFYSISSLEWIVFSNLCFFLWFLLLLSKKSRMLNWRLSHTFMLGIPLIFLAAHWKNSLLGNYITQSYDWIYSWGESIWPYLYSFYYLLLGIGLYICIGFLTTKYAGNSKEKIMVKIIFITAIISLIIGSLSGVVLPKSNIYFIPSLANVIALLWAFGITYYAMPSHKHVSVTPVTAAEHIISTMNDALILVDRTGYITSVNSAMATLSGYRKSHLEGIPVNVLFPDKDAAHSLIETALKDAVYKNLTVEIQTKDQEQIQVSLSSSVLKDDEGSPAGTVYILRDLSERERAKKVRDVPPESQIMGAGMVNDVCSDLMTVQDQLNKTQRQLLQSEKLAAIGQLAAGIAHEINNPIAFINSNLSIFGYYTASLREVLDAVAMLKEAIDQKDMNQVSKISQHIAELGKDLDISYILNDIDVLLKESGEGMESIKKIVLNLKTFSRMDTEGKVSANINTILDGVLNIVWHEIKYKAEVRKEYSDLPFIECNPHQVGQVFLNILINAVHAIEQRGLIVIKTYLQHKQVYVEISDSGTGMSKELQRRIFDPFFTTKEIGKGTGLGLSISDEIVKKHGGTIEIESELDKGTRFTVSFPV